MSRSLTFFIAALLLQASTESMLISSAILQESNPNTSLISTNPATSPESSDDCSGLGSKECAKKKSRDPDYYDRPCPPNQCLGW